MSKKKKQSKKTVPKKNIKQKTVPKKQTQAKKKIQPKKEVTKTNFWLEYKWAAILLFILPFALYAASFQFGYVLDDAIVLSENNFVKKGFAGIAEIFGTESFTGYLGEQKDLVVGARYRPLSIATFAIEHQLYGLKPGYSHFINVLLYALTGLLVFRLLHLILPKNTSSQWYLNLAFIAALLFILHPIHTEAVANIKGRDEILTLLLSLATLYFSHRYIQNNHFLTLIWVALTFFLAILAKENAITFLAVIPVSLLLLGKASIGKVLRVMMVLLVVFFAYLAIRFNVVGYLLNTNLKVSGIMNDPFIGTTFLEKYATIMLTLGKYILLLIFPHPLTHDYYPYQIPIVNWGDWRVIASLLLHLGMVYWAIVSYKKAPIISWSIAFYLFTLSIVSNIVFSVGTFMNERFIYVSSLGLCLLLAYLIVDRLPKWLKLNASVSRTGVLALIGVIALGYAFKTFTRVPAWKDAMSLNRAAIKVSTNSARANSYMAYALYQEVLQTKEANRQQELINEALPFVNRSLEIYPEYSDATTCKAGLVASQYQIDGDVQKLLDEFHQLLINKHVSFIDRYLEYLNPRSDNARLANFYYKTGYELMSVQQKNYPLAIKYLNYGVEVAPADGRMYEGLAETYLNAGNRNQAQTNAQRALQYNPGSVKAIQVLQAINK
ncbi:MAG: hypothetical protein AAFO07_22450 [Bacteroidota bacterium]